ncbi:MAG: hypothetical protein COB17_02630 [Sulfurimonas sp.]|nr:MAG: hypothetical protein COB17_02630 [Sulfurimonas sp.]
MVKSFLILISLQIILFSHEQIILVISDNLNSSKAKLRCFEDNEQVFDTIDVNIGKNGLALGIGKIPLKQKIIQILKYEGDKKAPIGIFKLTHVFGYKKVHKLNMPYLYADKDLICVDDSKHKNYNQIISMSSLKAGNKAKSFEYMRRDDLQYELGIVVEHNKAQIKGRGSCIFLHVQKSIDKPTAGCTSMPYKDLKKIITWLNISKNPLLIQIPKSLLKELLNLYPKLKF